MQQPEEIALVLTDQESHALNAVLVENCMSMVELFSIQKEPEGQKQAQLLVEMSLASQQSLFTKVLRQKDTYPKTLALFTRSVVESSVERMEGLKEQMVKEGDKKGFELGERQTTLKSVIKKINDEDKEESKIIV